MKRMQGCKVFRCDNCNKLKSISQQLVTKAAYTVFNHRETELIFNVHHVQICEACRKKIGLRRSKEG